MKATYGYYDGTVCVPSEDIGLQKNQKVIITALDEYAEPKPRKLGTLEGKSTVQFPADWEIIGEEQIFADLAESRKQIETGFGMDMKSALEEMGKGHGFVST